MGRNKRKRLREEVIYKQNFSFREKLDAFKCFQSICFFEDV